MSGIRILIVDDSVTIRAMLEQVIAGDPDCIVVGVAADAGDAKDLVATSWPDVITLDLTMPGIGGLGFLRELQNVSHPPVVVISSTTKDGAPETAEALAEGAAACFDKSRLLQEIPRFLRTLKRAGRAGQKRKSSPEPMRRHIKANLGESELHEPDAVS